MQPLFIAGYDQGGLIKSRKPFMVPNEAFTRLENAYIYRDRVIKRGGLKEVGRLKRCPTALAQTATQAGADYDDTDLLNSVRATEANAEIEPGGVIVTIDIGNAGVSIYNDATTSGILTYVSGTYTGSGTINYITGAVHIDWTVEPGAAITVEADLCYFPSLPCMGITTREVAGINLEKTIFYDTKYAYAFVTDAFAELISGTTWAASNSDFFWSTNYRGSNPQDRLYFVTNFLNTAANPMRYTDGATWTTFAPTVDANTTFMYQARILIPYYGRMIALNVWEGETVGGAVNIFNRCRYSQIGNPIEAFGAGPPATGAWRSDVKGKGGFIDAPTSEAIISARFMKNTLLVQFERSTWQLRYAGNYGIPFIWERISSDFGAESTFSTVLFDEGVLGVGDKAIVKATANTVARIDEKIPDQVFDIQNQENGPKRVQGVRDFFKELVYWCYTDADTSGDASSNQERVFPNKVLVYNYKNDSFSIFDDRVTAFGTFQSDSNITWDSTSTFWDDESVLWDDDPNLQSQFPLITSGNQQGYIHIYNESTVEAASLSVTGIDTSVTPNRITVINHNLENTFSGTNIQPEDEGYTVIITGSIWSGTNPGIDDAIYAVKRVTADTLDLYSWDGSAYVETPIVASGTLIGGAELTVNPQMFIQSKDFNPYLGSDDNLKLIYADFLTDYSDNGEVAIELYMNAGYAVKGNLLTGQTTSETNLPTPYYTPASEYAWHRLYATANGQFVRVVITMNDDQMNSTVQLNTLFTLNAMTLWVRPGGKTIF